MCRKSYLVTFLLLILLLCGCSIQVRSSNQTPLVFPSPTSVQVTEIRATIKPPKSTLTPNVNNVASAAANSETTELKDIPLSSCLDIAPQIPQDKGVSGNLFVMRFRYAYILDIRSGLKEEVIRPVIIHPLKFFISPNGKWLAYSATQTNISTMWTVVEPTANILDYDPTKNIEWGRNTWHQLEGWATNETLIITRKIHPDSFFSTMIVNPFTGETKEFILEDLPNYKYFKSSGIGLYHFPSSNLVIDPSLKRIVYPEFIDGHDYISLWNLETGKNLARLEDLYAFSGDPLWAQDGSDFLVSAATVHTDSKSIFDWFQVSRDGLIRQITHFSDVLQSNSISNASRSVDGRYLAFKMQYTYDAKESVRYYVLDLKTQNLEGFCIDSVHTPSSRTEKQPVWSPDGRYIVISNTDDDENGSLILVDIMERLAYKVAEGVYARGWIIKP